MSPLSKLIIFTALLLGCSHSGAPFRDVFSILVTLSFGVVLQLSNISPGGNEMRVIGKYTRRKRDNKKKFNNHIIGSIIISKTSYTRVCQMRGNVDGIANMCRAVAATEHKQCAVNQLGRFFLRTQRVFIAPCGRNFAVKVCRQTVWSNSPTFSFHLSNFFS